MAWAGVGSILCPVHEVGLEIEAMSRERESLLSKLAMSWRAVLVRPSNVKQGERTMYQH